MDKNKFNDILNDINPEILENTDVDLVEDGILDSILIMMMVSKLETAFEICIDPDDIMPENFESAETIWNTVSKYKEN